jgi:hypothetical protein
MSTISGTTPSKNTADNVFDMAAKGTKARKDELDTLMKELESGTIDEGKMVQLNMAASRFTTMISLSSGLVKSLTDTEKQVANKM